jgi:hypothetical protein
METVLLALLLMVVMFAIAVGVVVGVGAWSLNRRNRLAPGIETGAPLLWIWSPTQPARLHRRLQAAVVPVHTPDPSARRTRATSTTGADAAIGAVTTLDDVCRSLTGQAAAVDRDVIQASRLPRRARRARLRVLQGEVAEIERLTVRVHHHRATQTQPSTLDGTPPRSRADTLAGIGGHLDALAEAHAELHAIEQANGLDDPERILGSIAAREPLPATPPAPTPPAPAPGSRLPGPAAPPQRRAAL